MNAFGTIFLLALLASCKEQTIVTSPQHVPCYKRIDGGVFNECTGEVYAFIKKNKKISQVAPYLILGKVSYSPDPAINASVEAKIKKRGEEGMATKGRRRIYMSGDVLD